MGEKEWNMSSSKRNPTCEKMPAEKFKRLRFVIKFPYDIGTASLDPVDGEHSFAFGENQRILWASTVERIGFWICVLIREYLFQFVLVHCHHSLRSSEPSS